MFRNIKCITFDLDDTLWPVAPVIERAEQKLYDWLSQHYPKITANYSVEALTQHRSTWNQTVPELAHDVTRLRWQHLVELAEAFGYTKALADDGLALFRDYRNQVTPFQSVQPVLSELEKSYTIGAITNGNAQLEKMSIGKHFKFSISAEKMGANKPCSSLFHEAALKAGAEFEQLLHIGDSAEADVIGANKAGCRSVWFNPARQAWPGGRNPDAVIHCISELPALVSRTQ
jgi:putative hydrolase of the HAD superfamily